MEKKTKTIFKEGDFVVPIKNVDFRGNQIPKYDSKYIITAIRENNTVLLSAKRGNNYYYWATLKTNNIKKVEE